MTVIEMIEAAGISDGHIADLISAQKIKAIIISNKQSTITINNQRQLAASFNAKVSRINAVQLLGNNGRHYS